MRELQGILKGFDQTVNVILDECKERTYDPTEGVEQVALGLYILRGDNLYVFIDTFFRFNRPTLTCIVGTCLQSCNRRT